ncbi:Thymidylate kinase [Podospora bellae-mahoneyi]|uniref:dTMP kinase n=1 Tax=Podospora bellae-mahoneyi TaxID=2093777 RepID=A0ABR0FMN0_9PEZI|nr:Thymidylate kinase [Podospora bellae-mahoneyi]
MPQQLPAGTRQAICYCTSSLPSLPSFQMLLRSSGFGLFRHKPTSPHLTDERHLYLSSSPFTMTSANDGNTKPTRGALIVLEGLDRSGKTTQVKLLEQRFVELGKSVKVMRFPDRTTPIGQMINSYLTSQTTMSDHVIHLLFSANRWEAASLITSLLSHGTTVICDRYYYSGIVYSAAKHNPLLPLSWARSPEVGLPRPDLVLFLDLDEQEAKKRGGWGGEVYEKAETQRRVRELFWGLSLGKIVGAPHSALECAPGEGAGTKGGEEEVAVGPPSAQTPDISGGVEHRFRQEEEDLHVVDASASVEEVAEGVWKVVRDRVEVVERGEVGKVVRRVS